MEGENFMYSRNDLDEFMERIYFDEIQTNEGGMKINDMFSLYFLLSRMKPKPTVVVESGIWKGYSTKLIRKTLGDDVKILCLDPLDNTKDGFRDENANTVYLIGAAFVDFEQLDLSEYGANDVDGVLCIFDDHQNAAQRMLQCVQKGVKHVFFNDNYPVNAGSHYSIQHLIDNDQRNVFDLGNQYYYSINTLPQIDMSQRDSLIGRIRMYVIFPNIFSGNVELVEGTFYVEGALKDSDANKNRYASFYENRNAYTWNTYVCLTIEEKV
jgi:hypothetical protein